MRILILFLVIFLAFQGLMAIPSKNAPGGSSGGSSGANGGKGGDGGNKGGAEHGGFGAGDRNGNTRIA